MKGTVLVADDEADLVSFLRLNLGLSGYRVLEASTGEQALTLAKESQPDCIILDVMMPGLDGPATLSALRSNPVTAEIPVVFLTAKAMASEIERLLGLGARGVLTKPFDPMSLPQELKNCLGRP